MKYITATCAVVVLLFACQTDPWDNHISKSGQEVGASLLDVVQENPEWSSFYQALVTTGYDTLLQSANTYTVFAPVNSAWSSVKMNDVAALRRIVANHIAYEKRLSTDRLKSEPLRMISGKIVSYSAATQSFNGAQVTSPDHVASNGVLHGANKLVAVQDNVWDNINKIRNNHVAYLKSLGHREMDMERSVQVGVNMTGQPVYDTVWVDVNDFLKEVPLNDEVKEWTYILLQNEGFNALYEKYKPYFTVQNDPDEALTASITSLNICRDFVFEGRIDISLYDTITSIYGVKVPVKGANIDSTYTYECSNGRVYVIDKSNIRLRDKIKPVIIEGENFVSASDRSFVYRRYKQWASGDYDIMLSGQTVQTDTVFVLDGDGNRIPSSVSGKDSVKAESKTFSTPNSAEASRANVNNFYVEYKAPVNSVSYRIYYVAFDDISSFSSDANHILRIEQKLFVSLPGSSALKRGNSASADAVTNGHLGDTICFVGLDTAGIRKETQLKPWTLDAKTQFLKRPLERPQAEVLAVPNVGELTLWLCNTTRRNTTRQQGMMFLDYIKLEPILKEE
jgi:uncharacterized surface protein with fasciclin (FAS1) repeats